MLKKAAALALIVPFLAIRVSAQGINTAANKDDWEEINFEFNSSVLVDGFPSLLRIAELLQMNQGYKVKIEGHTDRIGSNGYNDKLGLARAAAVRDFLVKYGARAAQIEVSSRGKTDLKYGQGKAGLNRTDEQRWMDRRVALTVADAQGRTVGAGGAREAIQALPGGVSQDCCNEILHRLDKLDALEKMLKDLADQNAALRDQLAGLRQAQDALRDQLAGLRQPPPPPPAPPAAPAPSAAEVAKAVNDEHEKRNPKFELLGLNAGPTSNGDATATAKGRYFSPFGDHYGVQSEGEYFYSKGQREGQFDLALVDRISRFQAGLYSSFKHVNLTGDQTGGTLGQAGATVEYLFSWGKIGAFGTKAFLDDALVNSAPLVGSNGVLMPDFVTQRYLRVVDQGGITATGPLFGKNYFEGNIEYLRATTVGDRMGGSLRLIFPFSNKVAFTLEGGVNATLLGPSNAGRVLAGLQFGNFMRPKELLAAEHATPIQIPRVRYEVLTRTVRVGHQPPIADAGPNQTLEGPATVTLNGSNSYSPDGDKLTYQWTQQSGPGVALSSPASAITTFAAAANQVYTFQLVVRDTLGAQSTARVTITTTSVPPPQILLFTALPAGIQPGQTSTLAWQVVNADTVTITSIGGVVPSGSVQVSPAATTVYQITATKGSVSVTATASITVLPPSSGGASAVRIVSYSSQVLSDGRTQLYCITENAVSVMLNGRTFPYTTEAVVEVNPAVPTQYPCVATGADGTQVTQTLTVQ